MKKIALYVVTLVVLVIILGISMTFVGTRPPVHATTSCLAGETTCLSGWAWSSNIGWISFNSTDSGAGGGPYDVAIDTSGNLTGYGWSSNIGWISFNAADLQAAPACTAITPVTVNTVSGAVNGWVRAVVGVGRTDGWDGCIELSGTNHSSPNFNGYQGTSTQGVTYATTTGNFTGFAWGGPVVGWLQFSPNIGVGGNPVVCTPAGCGVTVSDLILLAQDYGPGSSGTGVWTPNVTFNLPQSGSITVPLKWTIGNATTVKTASADWGVSSGSTVTASGKSVTVDNTDSVTFSAPGTYSLSLSYKLSLVNKTKAVSVVVNPYVPPTNQCVQPAHTVSACGTTNSGPASVIDICPTTSVPDCQFQCAPGYKVKNGMCAKSSIQEI